MTKCRKFAFVIRVRIGPGWLKNGGDILIVQFHCKSFPLIMHIVIFYADNLHQVLSSTLVRQQVNFNFESTFVKQYFGTDHSHELSYEEFVQLLQVVSRNQTLSSQGTYRLEMISACSKRVW